MKSDPLNRSCYSTPVAQLSAFAHFALMIYFGKKKKKHRADTDEKEREGPRETLLELSILNATSSLNTKI